MYGSIVVKSAKTIAQEIVNYVVSKTKLTDLLVGSPLAQVIMAVARSHESLYLQVAKIPAIFAIASASGDDLTQRAVDYNTTRAAAQYAVGMVRFSRTNPVAQALAIPAGTKVATSTGKTYTTLVSATIPGLATQSADVGIIAAVAGAASNMPVGAVVTVVTTFNGPEAAGLACQNLAPVQSGADAESDAALRQRLVNLVLGLNRTSPISIPARAMQISIADGSRVRTAALIEDPLAPGRATLYVDNGTGTTVVLESHGTAIPLAGEVLVAVAGGGEARFRVQAPPIEVNGAGTPQITLYRTPLAGAPQQLVVNVAFYVIPSTGQIKLDPVLFPAGLTAGDKLEAVYFAWGGLIRAVQWDTDGRGSAPTTYPGGRAAGVFLSVRAPTVYKPAITVRPTVASGYTAAAVRTAVQNALLTEINSLGIGEDVVLARLYDVAMDVAGVTDFVVVVPAPADPPANIVVGDNQLVRLVAADIVVQ